MASKSSQGIMVVGPAQAAQLVKAAYEIRRPAMIWGPPGGAKSSVVRQVAEQNGLDFIDLRLVQIDSVDLRGLPYKDERDGQVVMGFAPSSILPRKGSGILFLDELPQAPTLVQNAASELLLDRTCGEYRLPDGWSIIAAGNRRGDRAGTTEIPSHLKNRMIHFELQAKLDDWIEWALTKNISPQVIAFLKMNPARLYEFDPDALAYPTLRTWEFVSDILNHKVPEGPRAVMISGCVGERVAQEVEEFLSMQIDLPSYEDIVADPLHAPIPTKQHLIISLFDMIGKNAKLKDADALLVFLKRAAKETMQEHVLFGVISIMEESPELNKHAGLRKLLDTLGEEETPEATKKGA